MPEHVTVYPLQSLEFLYVHEMRLIIDSDEFTLDRNGGRLQQPSVSGFFRPGTRAPPYPQEA